MEKPDKKKKSRSFRLALVDAVSHERIWSFRYTSTAMIIAIVSFVIIVLVGFFCLIAYTPFRSFIPGYPDAVSPAVLHGGGHVHRRVLRETDQQLFDGHGLINAVQPVQMVVMGVGIDQPVNPGNPEILQHGNDFLPGALISAVQHPDLILIPENGGILIPDGRKPDLQQIVLSGKRKIRPGIRKADAVDDLRRRGLIGQIDRNLVNRAVPDLLQRPRGSGDFGRESGERQEQENREQGEQFLHE